jgi:hypothetical protein
MFVERPQKGSCHLGGDTTIAKVSSGPFSIDSLVGDPGDVAGLQDVEPAIGESPLDVLGSAVGYLDLKRQPGEVEKAFIVEEEAHPPSASKVR